MAAACWLKSARAALALDSVEGTWQAGGRSDRETGCGVSSDDDERQRITIKDRTSGYKLKDCKASLADSGKHNTTSVIAPTETTIKEPRKER